jgi:hypothetical protein
MGVLHLDRSSWSSDFVERYLCSFGSCEFRDKARPRVRGDLPEFLDAVRCNGSLTRPWIDHLLYYSATAISLKTYEKPLRRTHSSCPLSVSSERQERRPCRNRGLGHPHLNIQDKFGLLPTGFSSESTCLVCMVFSEAGTTSAPRQKAVASVILNRLAYERQLGISSTLCDVVAHGFDAFGQASYRYCVSCNEPRGLLAKTLANIGGGWEVTTDATYFANNTPGMIRKRNRQDLVPVSVPSCRQFIFHKRSPFHQPSRREHL